MKLNTYRLPGFQIVPVGNFLPDQARPAAPANLKHTAPREKCLCLKQEVHTTWESVPDPEICNQFKVLAKKHNDQFNPSGVPFKSRRPIEETVESQQEQQAEPLPARDGQYPDIATLKAGWWRVAVPKLPFSHIA